MAVERFLRQAKSWGVEVSGLQRELLLGYAEELSGYSRANVIGTRDVEKILLDHILDSLSCLIFEPLSRARSLVDVGSGGGLPGLPIKVLRPQMDVTLLEATAKKADFLRYVAGRLGLEGVRVVNDRVESAGKLEEYRGAYDMATVRAVAGLDVISEYCAPLVKKGGYVVSMKGPVDPQEMAAGEKAARLLKAEISGVIQVPFLSELPEKRRNLVVLRKLAGTPERYPRKNGIPRKKPLGAAKRK